MGQKPLDSGDTTRQPVDTHPQQICLTGQDYLTFQPQIYRYIRAQISYEAEDLTADVFRRALTAQANGHGAHSNLSGWLYQIARSVITDHYRVKQRQPTIEPLNDLLNIPSSQNVEKETLFSIEITHLTAHLPDHQQEWLQKVIDGWDGNQLAAHYGIAPHSARQRTRRIRQDLLSRWNP